MIAQGTIKNKYIYIYILPTLVEAKTNVWSLGSHYKVQKH